MSTRTPQPEKPKRERLPEFDALGVAAAAEVEGCADAEC